MIRIEQATTEHIPQMADLLGVLFSEEVEFRADREKQIRGLRMIVGAPERGNFFVATEDETGDVVGMLSLLFTISTAKGSPVCWLEDMVIRADRRGQGIGTRLLNFALAYAKSHGFTRITLLTDRMNENSIRFYEKHGFEPSPMLPMRLHLGS
jgi:GNAT superfamily N-acetyltransferase